MARRRWYLCKETGIKYPTPKAVALAVDGNLSSFNSALSVGKGEARYKGFTWIREIVKPLPVSVCFDCQNTNRLRCSRFDPDNYAEVPGVVFAKKEIKSCQSGSMFVNLIYWCPNFIHDPSCIAKGCKHEH